ncbi:hypothetical protein KSP40_PGU000735 [Platanthera guangdongensis]|uniref:DUF7812 domain-containing protein n=1 Tax=Platanthera guangdongensis TaxID=2320717 RepID=A0ABR2MKN8_9ASPA
MEDLRNFHCLLKELDPYESQGQVFTENRYHNPSVAKVKSDVLIMLSDSLFEELLKQFENIQALLKCSVDGVVEPNPESQFTNDEFIVLLRCCLMMVQFLEFDTSILWGKCGVLLKILGNVCPLCLGLDLHDCSSVTTINPFSQCCNNFIGRINEESYEMLKFFSMILEVFIAMFSENVGLRKNLILVYNLTSNSEKLCSCRNADSDSFNLLVLSTQTGCHDKVSRPSCITYDCLSLSASITRVSGCGTDQQVQKFLHDMFGDYGGIHMELKFMLAHISSLLVFSLRRKLDFLWKALVFTLPFPIVVVPMLELKVIFVMFWSFLSYCSCENGNIEDSLLALPYGSHLSVQYHSYLRAIDDTDLPLFSWRPYSKLADQSIIIFDGLHNLPTMLPLLPPPIECPAVQIGFLEVDLHSYNLWKTPRSSKGHERGWCYPCISHGVNPKDDCRPSGPCGVATSLEYHCIPDLDGDMDVMQLTP